MRAILLALFACASAPVTAGPWQPWGPPGSPSLRVGIAAHPRIPGMWLAAREYTSLGDGFVTHLSTDGGTSWALHSEVAGESQSDTVPQVALAGGYGYAANDRRLARSQDGAVSWTPLDFGVLSTNVLVGANPDNGSEVVVYRSFANSLFHSVDAGTTWTQIPVPLAPEFGTVDWTTRTVYLYRRSVPQPVVVKSLDGGSVWTPGPTGVSDVSALGGKAVAAAGNGLVYSPDSGQTWQGVTVDGAEFPAASVAHAPTQPSIVYALEHQPAEATTRRVVRSVDGGASFVVVGTIVGFGGLPDLAVEAGAGDRLMASFDGGVLRSTNGGASWQLLPRPGDFPSQPSVDVLFDASNPAVRFVNGSLQRQRSFDAGVTWQTVGDPVTLPVMPIATSPTRSGLVFGSGYAVLRRSVDTGTTWTDTPTVGGGRGIDYLGIVPGDPPLEYFLFASGFLNVPPRFAVVNRSTDEGVTWTGTAAPPDEILSFARAPGSPLVLYAGTNAPVGIAGLYRSSDHGASWQPIVTGDLSGPVTAITVDPSNRQRVFVAYSSPTGAQLLRTDNAGATWTSVWTAMPTTTITAIAVDPVNGLRVYVGTDTQGAFRSVDAGASWSALDQGLTDHRVRGLTFDPRDATKLYASTDTGPYLADLSTGSPAGNRWAIEYYHQAFNHYFVSADLDEIAGLDAGVFQGWARTGESFRVGPTPSPDQAPVCRFFGVGFAPLSSHFYTPYPDECAIVKQDPKWFYEKIAFGLRLPEANKGCLPGYAPLYRLWNRNRDGAPNHRYTTSLVTFDFMFGNGWVMEGEASTFVFACVPQ
jgi:hypothetical protein